MEAGDFNAFGGVIPGAAREALLRGRWHEERRALRRDAEAAAFRWGLPGLLLSLRGDRFAEAVGEVVAGARAHGGFLGRNGLCYHGAAAMRRTLFGGDGIFLVGHNAALRRALGRHHLTGHVAVWLRGAAWDFEGRPKTAEEVRAWGDLSGPDGDGFAGDMRFAGAPWGPEERAEAALARYRSEDALLSRVEGPRFHNDDEIQAHALALFSSAWATRDRLRAMAEEAVAERRGPRGLAPAPRR